MNDAKTIAVDTGRLPRWVVWGVIAICIAPWLLNALGVDFGVGAYGGPPLGDLEGLALTDALHKALAGSFVHALLEWTAFALALFTVALAFAHFSVHRDVATPIIGLALFLAGSVDAFHTLAATRLIPAVADNARFIPFTWAISRTFHAVIAMVGVTIFLVGGKRAFRYSPRFLLVTSVAFVLFAYLTIQLTAASPQLPVTEFPDSFVKRPYDVPALILFLAAGVFLYPRFLAQRQSVFAHALLIGVIPEVTTQLHMVFQSQALFDNSFNIAHFLKIVAYGVPFSGLALDYVRSHRERQRLDLALQHSTERVDVLRSTEGRLQEMFDDAPIMYVVVSMAEGPPVVTDCNKRFLSSLGYQREEVVGKGLDQFYEERSKSALAMRYEAGFPEEGSFQAEERGLLCRDGRIIRVIAWLMPMLDADGRATGGRLMYTDLSEQALAEEALAETQTKYQALVHSATDLIQTADTEGRLIFVNPAWLETLGYRADEAAGMDMLQVVAPEDHSRCRDLLGKVLGGEQIGDVAVRFLTKDGNMVDLQGTVVPRFDSSVVTGSYGYFRNVTQELVADREKTERTERNRRQQDAIVRIATGTPVRDGNLQTAVHEITEALAHTVEVERASVWLLAQGQAELGCFDLFERTPNEHSQIEALTEAEYPRYFEALQRERALEASDALSDPRTSEFTEGYLVPLGITSKLDVAVRLEGKVIGVVCLEHTGTPRVWHPDETQFASALADSVASVMLSRDRNRAEAKARRVAGELRQLIETANAPIFGVDLSGRVDEWNKMAATLSGYTKDEVVGRELVDFIAPEYRKSVGQVLSRALEGEDTANYEFPLVMKGGDRVEILLNATTRRDLERSITGVVGVGQDITARKQAEAEARLKDQAVASALSPIALASPGGPITYVNQAFLSLFGYDRVEEVIGKTDFDFAPDHAAVRRIHKIIAEHQSWRGQLEVQRRDGSRLIAEISVNMVFDDSGNPTSRMTSFFDVTERERAISELSEERALLAGRVAERTADLSAANAELARASRAKDEFLASMSHELRTPLNAILASSETLQEEVYGPINDRQRGSLELVEESGRHLLSLINDILDLAKVEAGKLELELDLVDLGEICEASMRFVKELAHKKRIKLTTSIDQQVNAVNVDGRRLKQILVNLLTNGVKFTPEGGQVGLEVVGDADQEVVRLSVWDTGIGISQEEMPQLFQPFKQLDTGLDRRYEGTGLGLSLVSRMVELHGGSVTVESAGEGEGSRFTVALPWAPAAAGAVEPPAVDAPSAPVRRALVVEDSPSAAELLQRYLKEMDVSCTVLDRGERVLEVASASGPDVILLDLLLPGESGWDVLEQLKADPQTRDIPVVIISVVDERVRGFELGAEDYLLKPFTRDQLHAALEISVKGRDVLLPASALVVPADPELEASPLILIAEDNEANIRSISGYLIAEGFRLAVARNGGEAVDQTRELRPDLILMDIQMPGVDGLEATRQIREDPEFSSLPIIALTALAMPGDRERILEAGANEYMAKPVSLRELVKTMDTLLARAGE